ncbi:uncharacterized protein PAC_10168 [Phialocephala subalpina]|uniref:Uncharacterized protein n=1 Tax=Phialocephala subalpina TaxID=576137 RepID=A0A1L7X5H7_9HELO|nr:uncharacterized protein PAC_10168 [Phialocephala subalpina]
MVRSEFRLAPLHRFSGYNQLAQFTKRLFNTQAPSASSLPHVAEPHEAALPDPTPSTPVRQIGKAFQSPLSDDQTATPQTALFTSIANGGALSPLTEDNRTAFPQGKAERIPPPLSSMGQQQTSLCNTASTQAQQVDREQSLLTQDSPAILPYSPAEETPALANMVAKAVHTVYEMSRRHEVPIEVYSRILTTIRPSLGGRGLWA